MWSRGSQQRLTPWLSRVAVVGVLTSAAVVALPWTGPARADDAATTREGTPPLLTMANDAGADATADDGTGTDGGTGDGPAADPGVGTGADPSVDTDTDLGTGGDGGTDDGSGVGAGGDPAIEEGAGDGETTAPPITDRGDGEPTVDPDQTVDPGQDEGSDAQASLSIEAEASPAVVEQGDTLTLTLTVSNAGPGTDPAVTVTTLLPDGFEIQSPVARYDAATGVWDVGEMLADTEATLTLVFDVTTEPDQVVASPSVSGEASDGLPIDDQTDEVIRVQPAHDDGAGTPRTADDEAPAPSVGGQPPGQAGAPAPQPDGPGHGGAGPSEPRPSTDGDDDVGAVSPSTTASGSAADPGPVLQGPSAQTRSEAPLMMLGWILLAAGVVLMLMGRLRRKRRLSWAADR